jgi:hypothetical protein
MFPAVTEHLTRAPRTAYKRLNGWDYGGCGSRVSPVCWMNASINSGRYWIRLSRFFTTATR